MAIDLNRRTRLEGLGSPLARLALLLGLAAHLAGFLALSVRTSPPATPATPTPFIAYAPGQSFTPDALLGEQAVLLDTEPLFLPTRWNTLRDPLPASRVAATLDPFPPAEPRLTLGTGGGGAVFPGEARAFPGQSTAGDPPPEPRTLLRRHHWSPLLTFGVRPDTGKAAPVLEGPSLRVETLRGGGESVLTRTFTGPEGDGGLWEPAVFLLSVGPAGAHGRPLLEKSSGDEELDARLRGHISRAFEGGALKSGYYRITVSP